MRQDKSTPQVDEAVIAEALRTSIPTARSMISDLEDAGFLIMRKPRGDLVAISEAVRTGNWTSVTEWDWKAWLAAVHAGFITKEAGTPRGEDAIAKLARTVPLTQEAVTAAVTAAVAVDLEPRLIAELPRGASIRDTPADFLVAVHGEDGLEFPALSGLSWLRDLLRSARNAGAIRALQGDDDDEGAVYDMLRAVEDMYRRLAPLTGQRPDIFDSENPRNRGEAA